MAVDLAGAAVHRQPVALAFEGVVGEGEVSYPAWSWLRNPAGQPLVLEVESPVRLFTKTRALYEPVNRARYAASGGR